MRRRQRREGLGGGGRSRRRPDGRARVGMGAGYSGLARGDRAAVFCPTLRVGGSDESVSMRRAWQKGAASPRHGHHCIKYTRIWLLPSACTMG
jgi:hypothetical protein